MGRINYGWIIVSIFFIIGSVLSGIRLSFGVFLKFIENDFILSRANTSALFSVSTILGSIFAVLGGWALDRYGPKRIVLLMGISTGASLLLTSQMTTAWQLFITYSLLLAIGTGAIYVVTMATVLRWFDKQRGLALGIAGSGVGLGMIIMPPLATYLIINFGWRMAYLYIGMIALVIVIPLSLFIKHKRSESSTPSDSKTDAKETGIKTAVIDKPEQLSASLSLMEAAKTKSFWLILFIWIFFASSSLLILTHLVPHITDIGFSEIQAATIASIIGGISILGRILMGIMSDKIGRKMTVVICSLRLQT